MNVESTASRAGHGASERAKRVDSTFRLSLPFSERRVLLLVGDALAINGAVLAALYLWAWTGASAFTLGFVRARWYWFPILTALWWFLTFLGDLYDVSIASRRFEVTRRIGMVAAGLLIAYLAAYFFLPRDALPRLFILFFVMISLIDTLLWRWTYATVFTLPPFRCRVLIVGAGWAGNTIAKVLAEHSDTDYHVIGFVDDDPRKQGVEVAGFPVLNDSRDLVALVQARRIEKIVLAITHFMRGDLFQALMDCGTSGIHIVRMPVLYEQLTRRVPIEHIGRNWIIEAMNGLSALGRLALWAKRLSDIFLGLIGTLVFLILLPFIALAITLDCPGPIFYRQARLGRGGRPFRVWKLRTMVPNAEDDGKAQWAKEDDDRITRVGKLLRKTRLDELPQVLNVLRGEMSIIGPRPERPEFIAELQEQIPFYRTRLCVKPGLTGWAQVHYGYGNSVEDALVKLQYDLYYIRHWSLWLDLCILFKTVGVVLQCKGM